MLKKKRKLSSLSLIYKISYNTEDNSHFKDFETPRTYMCLTL